MTFNTKRAVLVLSAALLFFTAYSYAQTEVLYQYPGDIGMWQHIYEKSAAYIMPDAKPRSVMIPHHDITTAQQNSMYKAIAQKLQPSVIVVIGPDHYEKGKACITIPTDDISYCTPQGKLELAKDLLHKLCQSELSNSISVQSDLWQQEHAIYAHTPFLGKYFPQAALLPIVLKPLASDSEFESMKVLARVLSDILPEDALIVASVDCSHYQIPRMTALHDSVTKNTIANKEDPRYIEVDSPETLTFLTEYNRLTKANLPVLIDMTSTYDFIPRDDVESTSHLYWAFYNDTYREQIHRFKQKTATSTQRTDTGYYQSTKNQTILIAGSGQVNAGIRTYWTWDRNKNASDSAEVLLRDLAGKEARFLSGFDALIFDPKVGTNFTQTKHGTTLFVQSISASELTSFVPQKSNAQTVSILVVTAQNNETTDIKDLFIFQTNYDVLILRYNDARNDTLVYVSALHTVWNLGVLYDSEGKSIEGALLALDWHNSDIKTELFEYTSETGIVPAIAQFAEEEDATYVQSGSK